MPELSLAVLCARDGGGVGTHAARTFLRGEGGGREGGGGVLTKENTSGDALALAESLNKAPGRLCLWSLEGVLSSRSHQDRQAPARVGTRPGREGSLGYLDRFKVTVTPA